MSGRTSRRAEGGSSAIRLEISRRSDLAVRAFRVIATAGGRVPGRDLARSIGCSAAFLSQVVPPLVRAGWVTSRPGPDGGYLLAVAAGSVSVLDVIEAVEGPFDDAQCALRRGPCGRRPCALHEAWAHAREALRAAFGDVPVVAG